jgi:hypothetical protein
VVFRIYSISRPTIVVNLDFANDTLPYECVINVCDLISVTDAMDTFNLGPNGGTYEIFFWLNFLVSIQWRESIADEERRNNVGLSLTDGTKVIQSINDLIPLYEGCSPSYYRFNVLFRIFRNEYRLAPRKITTVYGSRLLLYY